MGGKIGERLGQGAVDDKTMFQGRGQGGQGLPAERAPGQQGAEFTPAGGILGDPGIEMAVVGVPEFNAKEAPEARFLAGLEEFEAAGGIVYIREGHPAMAQGHGFGGQLRGGEGAVAEAEIAVGVEIHDVG